MSEFYIRKKYGYYETSNQPYVKTKNSFQDSLMNNILSDYNLTLRPEIEKIIDLNIDNLKIKANLK